MQTSLLTRAERPVPTRAAALHRLAAFVPHAGRLYAAQRNFDRGPAERTNVSTLSPYLRHRVVTETEVLEAVLGAHTASAAQKFVQEVFWRTYWKGWLQAHPTAWSDFQTSRNDQFAELDRRPDLRRAYDEAVNGQTGIDAFDAWVSELATDNYLHNHARMWFASIWIFTLGLPWELGADLFMTHLLDGDPASNTLSWRWVAGLHTRGRTYRATRDNIRHYTEGRFELGATLAKTTPALEDEAASLVTPAPVPGSTVADEPSLLVLHEDDVHGDLRDVPVTAVRGVCAILTTAGRAARQPAAAVSAFSEAVLREGVERCATHASARDLGVIPHAAGERLSNALVAAATACGAARIITPFAPLGPARDALDGVAADVRGTNVQYVEFGRRYDRIAWPAATRGFFQLRTHIPRILTELGISAG